MSRLAVMAHFDHGGDLAPHTRRQVVALATSVDDLVVVSTAPLTDPSRRWLARHARVVERENVGYDFLSYKVGLETAGDLTAYDEVVVCNDTYVGPLVSYSDIFATMADRPVDFWGLTESRRFRPHVQSFFVAFRPRLVASRFFGRFWSEMEPQSDRQRVIARFEIGMSRRLYKNGFTSGSYFTETDADRRVATRRARWYAAHRSTRSGLTEARELLGRAPTDHDLWNPAAALADRALVEPTLGAARLPYVKLDTLRYDPYALGADHLLSLCEQEHPDAFDGVRDHLERTAHLYPRRPGDALRRTPAALRPLLPLVRYRRPR